jgi:hypothetical protein
LIILTDETEPVMLAVALAPLPLTLVKVTAGVLV